MSAHPRMMRQLPLAPALLSRPMMQFARFSAARSTSGIKKLDANIQLVDYPPERIRNFCIIAHIDAGKSTLADRLLERTGTIQETGKNEQVLDSLAVERERGITVKARAVTIFHESRGTRYMYNLIDTPGHVDFSYEVSRALSACQGAILLVDGTAGIQAQTLANFYAAFALGLTIVPVINKVDLPTADIPKVMKELTQTLEFKESEILTISAKRGIGVEAVLDVCAERFPPPPGAPTKPLKALLFDSWYDGFRGAIGLLEIIEGSLKRGDKIVSAATKLKYEVLDCGILRPEQASTDELKTGMVGYVITNMRSTNEAKIGDTFHHDKVPVEPLPGFKVAKPVVFAGIYPVDSTMLGQLEDAIKKLTLNASASVSIEKESSIALGVGFRCGFLGLLHMDVFRQRLEQEYGAEIILTAPTVPYKIRYDNGTEVDVSSPSDFPDEPTKVSSFLEPLVEATIILPKKYLGATMDLCQGRRGVQTRMDFMGDDRLILGYKLPLGEVITDFYDHLKSLSAGYASFDYEEAGYAESQLVKLTVLLNDEQVDALSFVVHKDRAVSLGRRLTSQLREHMNRKYLFQVKIQAAVDGKIVARETVAALRKDVTAKLYGGDVTRKNKLLDKQKAGKKKRSAENNSVHLPNNVFSSILKSPIS